MKDNIERAYWECDSLNHLIKQTSESISECNEILWSDLEAHRTADIVTARISIITNLDLMENLVTQYKLAIAKANAFELENYKNARRNAL